MYYPLTPYVFIFTAIPFVILLFALISLYRNARNENGFSSLVVMLLCVGVSLLSLTTAEILVNLIPGLRELRLKIPVAITWLVFLATFIFLAKYKCRCDYKYKIFKNAQLFTNQIINKNE